MSWENKLYHIEERLRELAKDLEVYEQRELLNAVTMTWTKERMEYYEAKLKALEESKES